MNEEERLVRLFVVVPKSLGESELREHFNQFGDVDYVSIVRDRTTKVKMKYRNHYNPILVVSTLKMPSKHSKTL